MSGKYQRATERDGGKDQQNQRGTERDSTFASAAAKMEARKCGVGAFLLSPNVLHVLCKGATS